MVNLDLQAPPPFLPTLGKPVLPWDEWYTCTEAEGQRIYRTPSKVVSEVTTVSTPDTASSYVVHGTQAETGSYEIAVGRLLCYLISAVNKKVE